MFNDDDDHHDHDQQTFDDLLTAREPASGTEAGLAAASFTASGPARREQLILLRRMLLDYIGRFEVGHTFQAVDFSHWLDSQAEQPDETVIDTRATGGLFLGLVNAGVLAKQGYANNGGNKARNYHGTPRVVYRIVSHEFTNLGWLEESAA